MVWRDLEMAKGVIFRCRECGHVSPKWMGRCPDCQTWNSLEPQAVSKTLRGAAGGSSGAARRPTLLADVPQADEPRLLSGVGEWDRVLGGGLVAGSLVLLAGDPGIGKSTLLLQVLGRMAERVPVLYVSGEESLQQLRLRWDRLQLPAGRLHAFAETTLDAVEEALGADPPVVLAVDSIQTMQWDAVESAPGSVAQVRECAGRLMRLAKERRIGVFIVGHVTKEGVIAGPRMLEHLVDTVLYLEGDRSHAFRLLRAVKNRFGATNEIGVFEMKETGLQEVADPSRFLLAERPIDVSGSVVACTMEGSRPLLVELQALVTPTGWMQPRRTSIGVDVNRLSLLLAVLEKKLGLNFSQQDVFVNVAGGVRLMEPAADLPIIAALMSSALDRPLPPDLVAWGEVGLAGEVRAVGHGDARVVEAVKLGFLRHLIPAGNAERLPPGRHIDPLPVRSLREVHERLFSAVTLPVPS